MSGKMSVKERLSLEFVTAKGAIAYSGASCPNPKTTTTKSPNSKLAGSAIIDGFPVLDLFDGVFSYELDSLDLTASVETSGSETSVSEEECSTSSAALDAVADLKALFAAVGND